MTAHVPVRRQSALEIAGGRFVSIERDVSYLAMPKNWKLRIWGQGVGGYAPDNGSVSRHATKERAEQVASVWIESGIYPAHQGDV